MMRVVELTKENENRYLSQIEKLEQIVLEKMKNEGREGQLFATGKDDISEYVHSNENTVLVATDENDTVEAAAYITQGQKPFTYNDITKYFKFGENYKRYVKSQYDDEQKYKKDLLDIYQIKIKAFQYAKEKILRANPGKDISQLLEEEIRDNGFHEKSQLRDDINKFMSEYIEHQDKSVQEKYDRFYWITVQDISEEFGRKIDLQDKEMQQYEQFMQTQTEYEKILQEGKLKIYERPEFDETKYYSANTGNSIELDTYITLPQNRNAGLARIIVYEGIKKHMQKHFSNPENREIYLCSTLHRDNLSSKYVSEFFGLRDSLYVNRRQGRDREVHICQIQREKAMEYLSDIADKLAVLYGYNPNNKQISNHTIKKVLEEQLEYEKRELARLKKAKATDKKFKGINLKFIKSKTDKIQEISQQLENLDIEKGENYGD